MIFKLLICFSGIFFSYILNGYSVEYLSTAFGKKIFTFYVFMIILPSICNLIFGKILVLSNPEEHKNDNPIPQIFYFLCSVFQIASMLCSNASLAYISYPTQLVLKSSKPISVLLASLLCISKGIHHPSRIFSTFVIVVGIMGFMHQKYLSVSKDDQVNQTESNERFVYGYGLVFVSLLFDGMLGFIQDKIRMSHKLNPHSLIYSVNVYSSILLTICLVVTNELPSFVIFVTDHPTVFLYLISIGVTGAIGQSFIFYTIANFGPLTCSIITNIRKFFQIFLSVFLFSHLVTLKMWFCVCIVFSGLILDVWSQLKFQTVHH